MGADPEYVIHTGRVASILQLFMPLVLDGNTGVIAFFKPRNMVWRCPSWTTPLLTLSVAVQLE